MHFAPNQAAAQEYGYSPTVDRDSRQLTTGGVVPMRRPAAPLPERFSIFGDTYDGVPNPNVLVQHGYPTRFHGPIFNVPQPAYRYASRPYALAPFWGVDDRELSGLHHLFLIGLVGLAALGAWTLYSTRKKR